MPTFDVTKPHHVYDKNTGALKGTYSTAKRARNVADKLDNAYGGYKHIVKTMENGKVWSPPVSTLKSR